MRGPIFPLAYDTDGDLYYVHDCAGCFLGEHKRAGLQFEIAVDPPPIKLPPALEMVALAIWYDRLDPEEQKRYVGLVVAHLKKRRGK